jgi:FKBP-type peptidyl-prolyl cis-trans isomerase SlyD|tara:strand:- start:204 stop:866 length:663 start_codon:yes stop_codon:yes gene_type:complete
MGISKKDFIEIEYTGKVKEDGTIFDTTDEKIAKENNLHGHDFSPVVVCVGEGHVLPGIDKDIEGKEVGKEYEIDIKPEDAFGNKDAKLIHLIPTNKFKQQNIQPMPGMQLNIDGMMGTIKTVSGGRTMVDFNHPLAGKELHYKVKINKKIDDDKEKLGSVINLTLGTKDFKVDLNEGNAKISLKTEIPKEIHETMENKVKELIPTIKKVEFLVEKEQKNK